ncbi:histidine kinase [Rhodococcus sp. HNM0569]|uniref:sensor histidine kinase n=1 Tax=Rhodococcus sp. HNM0569 TaxID=2716340 RepID=UPI00146B796C|nr:histidine kinase [Rhodococcus sp. HNM0569]NLU84928.1 sensor histidine kinase [Rhodococcus sp. HNM0569]
MRRFSLWLRERPVVADALLALVLLAFDVSAVATADGATWVQMVLSVLICAPVVVRRAAPEAFAAIVLTASLLTTFVSYSLGQTEVGHPGLIVLAVALYTLVVNADRRIAAAYLAALAVDVALATWLLDQYVPATVAFTALVYALSWTAAEFVGARRAYDREVAARLAVAELDRERRAEDAVAAERTRIARELHDVVAHAVSVMIVQADGASYALDRDPDAARAALGHIAGSGRAALAELRRTVSLLRTEPSAESFPQHGTAGLAHLVSVVRDAGLRVDLELTGQLDGVSAPVSLGVHRIVQEALTNVLRHAGPGAHAWVRVTRTSDAVELSITDSGGAGDPEWGRGAGASPERFALGTGTGVAGMRERATVLGGTVDVGPRRDGWAVRARLPLEAGE